MNLTRQQYLDMELGRWIRENPGKIFGIATLKGVHRFVPEFIPNDGKLKGVEGGPIIFDEAITLPSDGSTSS